MVTCHSRGRVPAETTAPLRLRRCDRTPPIATYPTRDLIQGWRAANPCEKYDSLFRLGRPLGMPTLVAISLSLIRSLSWIPHRHRRPYQLGWPHATRCANTVALRRGRHNHTVGTKRLSKDPGLGRSRSLTLLSCKWGSITGARWRSL